MSSNWITPVGMEFPVPLLAGFVIIGIPKIRGVNILLVPFGGVITAQKKSECTTEIVYNGD